MLIFFCFAHLINFIDPALVSHVSLLYSILYTQNTGCFHSISLHAQKSSPEIKNTNKTHWQSN